MSAQELEKEIERRLEMLRLARERRSQNQVQLSPGQSPQAQGVKQNTAEEEQQPRDDAKSAQQNQCQKQNEVASIKSDVSLADSTSRLKKIIQQQNKQIDDQQTALDAKDQRIKQLLLQNASYRKQVQQPPKQVQQQNTRQQQKMVEEQNIQLLAENKALKHQIAQLQEDHTTFALRLEELSEQVRLLTQQNTKLIEQQANFERRLQMKNQLIAKLQLQRTTVDKNAGALTNKELLPESLTDSAVCDRQETPQLKSQADHQSVQQNSPKSSALERNEKEITKCMEMILQKQAELKQKIIKQQ